MGLWTVEMIKLGGNTTVESMKILLNKCLIEGVTRQNAKVILLYKKSDKLIMGLLVYSPTRTNLWQRLWQREKKQSGQQIAPTCSRQGSMEKYRGCSDVNCKGLLKKRRLIKLLCNEMWSIVLTPSILLLYWLIKVLQKSFTFIRHIWFNHNWELHFLRLGQYLRTSL